MSLELTLTLAAPDQPVWALLDRVSARLGRLGFRRSPGLYRAGYDPERGVFDEIPGEEIELPPTLSGNTPDPMKNWTGWATEFTGVDISAYVLAGRAPGNFINCFVDVAKTAVDRLIENRDFSRLYATFVAVAAACKAAGGFAQYEQAFEVIPSDRAVAAIKDNPQERGVPSLVGLVPRTAMSKAEVAAFAGTDFLVRAAMAGFWVLSHVDLDAG